MLRQIIPFILFLFAFAIQVKAAETIAPLISDNTFLVIRLDLEKIDFTQIAENVQKELNDNTGALGLNPMMLAAASEQLKTLLEPLQELNDTLRKNVKAKELYIISSTDFFSHQIPCVVAVPLPDEKPETLQTFNNLLAKTKIGEMRFAVRFARYGFYCAVPSPNYDDNSDYLRDYAERMVESQKEGMRQLYRTASTRAKPEVDEAFAELAGSPIQILLMRVPMFTAMVAMVPWDDVPFLQVDAEEEAEHDADSADPFADEKSADPFDEKGNADSLLAKVRYEVQEGITWLALGLNPQEQRAKWVIKSHGQGGAKRTTETFAALVEHLSGWIIEDAKYRYGNPYGQWFESKAELHKFLTLFLPKPVPQKEMLAITIDPAFKKANAALLEPLEKRMQEQWQELFGMPKRMQTSNQLKQIGLAIHNYHDV